MATVQAITIVYLIVAVVFVTCDSESSVMTNNNEPAKNLTMELTSDSVISENNTSVKDELNSDLNQLSEMTGVEISRNKDHSVTARMKMSNMFPLMLLPQLIMWGFLPIMLANMKMFVMQALMLNKMALSSAIFMTLRNIVFGPRPGPLVKYANYGYSHGKPHGHRRRVGTIHYRS